MAEEELQVAGKIPSWGRRVLEQAYSRILNASGYKTEDCSICRSNYFQLHTSPFEYTRIIPDPSKEERARCHGCELAKIIRLFWMEILIEKGKGEEPFYPLRCSIKFQERTSAFSVRTLDSWDDITLIKVTKPTKTEPWAHWLLSTLESSLGISRPPYIDRATEEYPISGDTGSGTAFDTAFSWFVKCSSDHQSCGSSEDPPVLPTRVLDISDRNNIRIFESNGCRGHYVSLSHRWLDGTKMTSLTRSNIESFKKQIIWEELTQTFRDAIIFTGEFSARYAENFPDRGPIQYIWIDSLCIIQNCAEDWKREANLMHTIYEDSIVTIAAATGTDGCFSKSHRHYKGFNIVNEQRPNPIIHLRTELPLHREGRIDSKQVPVGLFSRGWVLQERLLSRRYLVFAPDEIRWECLEAVHCECKATEDMIEHESPNDTGDNISPFRARRDDLEVLFIPKALKLAYHTSLTDDGPHRERHLRNWWRRLVQLYAKLDLTYEKDRLPAIEGLSNHFGRVTGMDQKEYAAGHWMPCLPYDLAWYAERPADINTNRAENVPSWSWASCSGPIDMPTEYKSTDYKLHVQFSLFPKQVLGCQPLLLKCRLFTGTTRPGTFRGTYKPDIVTSEIEIDVCQHILILSRSGSPWEWYFIRVEAIEGEEVRYRRKGWFVLEQGSIERPESYDEYEALMCSYFSDVSQKEIVLV